MNKVTNLFPTCSANWTFHNALSFSMLIDFELCQVQATKMECIALEESVYLISLLEEISLPQL